MKWAKKIMGCVSEYIDQRGKSMATACTSTAGQPYWGAAQQAVDLQQLKMRQAMAQQQAQIANAWNQASIGGYAQQPVNYRQTLGSTPNVGLPTFEQLEDPDSPFNLPLEALAVMWGARFGHRWVKDEDTADAIEENQELWSLVASRLMDAELLINQQYRSLDKAGISSAWKLVEKDHGNS